MGKGRARSSRRGERDSVGWYWGGYGWYSTDLIVTYVNSECEQRTSSICIYRNLSYVASSHCKNDQCIGASAWMNDAATCSQMRNRYTSATHENVHIPHYLVKKTGRLGYRPGYGASEYKNSPDHAKEKSQTALGHQPGYEANACKAELRENMRKAKREKRH